MKYSGSVEQGSHSETHAFCGAEDVYVCRNTMQEREGARVRETYTHTEFSVRDSEREKKSGCARARAYTDPN